MRFIKEIWCIAAKFNKQLNLKLSDGTGREAICVSFFSFEISWQLSNERCVCVCHISFTWVAKMRGFAFKRHWTRHTLLHSDQNQNDIKKTHSETPATILKHKYKHIQQFTIAQLLCLFLHFTLSLAFFSGTLSVFFESWQWLWRKKATPLLNSFMMKFWNLKL